MPTFSYLELTDEEKQKYTLQEIEKLLYTHGTSFSQYESMPKFDNDDEGVFLNQLIINERKYNQDQQKEYLDQWLPRATPE